MKFTDLFINKPVLATVVSLFILLLGLRAASDLNVRQYPELQNAVISVSTAYIGADADLVQGFITTPMEREVATAEGIDYIVSTTVPGASTIQAYLDIETDPNEALTQVAAKVNKLRGTLPDAAEDPIVDLSQGQSTAAMYLSFYSEMLDNNQITDYLVRVVEPKLSTIPGVQRAQIIGAETFAMRIWLEPDRMTALEVTSSDVYSALARNNVLSAVGSTKGQMISIGLTAETDLSSAEQFRDLVVRSTEQTVVRLDDIARIELGSETYNSSVSFNGEEATFIGVEVSPDANALDVIAEVRRVWNAEILPELPTGLEADIPYDSTDYINNAIDEVIATIVEALIIVVLVIFLFLGSLRTVVIPAVAVPLSLVGALFLMLLMGFSINLLTLLAMVLAIGIVVDDAIIVLENIHRHIEDGMAPKDAALKGARELAWPVVAMTTTLVAVYIPIGFIGGLTGTLFVEFAFTLAGAVLLSGVVALTLSPMMCAKLLRAHDGDNGDSRLARWLDERFENLRRAYRRRLRGSLETKSVIAVFGLIVLVSCGFLFMGANSELAPEEDQGFVLASSTSDPFSTVEYLERYTESFVDLRGEIPELENVFIINGGSGGGSMAESTNQAITGFVLKPWNQRDRGTRAVLDQAIQPAAQDVAGLDVATFMPPALPTGGEGFPVEFVIGSTEPLSTIQELSAQVLDAARESSKFIFLNSDLNIDKPRFRIKVDRDKAALLGVDMATLGNDLSAMLAGGYVNRFSLDNRSYRVIPQVERVRRLNPDQLENYYTRSRSGELIPLGSLVTLEETVEPRQLKRFQQLNAVTISGVPRPGVTLGEALAVLDEAAAGILPPGYNVDYKGQSRQFKTEGAALLLTFAFALTVIYLVLAAQFESFRDPLIMLVTVPMSICGAMIFVSLGLTSLNIYTQVGLVTLIGVISKHGILIVEFANKLQEEGLSKRRAVEEAASIRLRPILMTTAALVLAMVPLLIATGAGAASRFSMGLVIATGMTIGTAFTLFVVPAMYLYLARDHGHSEESAL